MADAWDAFAELKKRMDAGEVTSSDTFGLRDYLKNNYLSRMAAAVVGIYGYSKQEAMYPLGLAEAGRRKPLHRALRHGSISPCQRLLVTDDV
jgi:hypothetical protein